jgi:hypothetical protein
MIKPNLQQGNEESANEQAEQSLKPAFHAVGPGEQPAPVNPPADQPAAHNPADIFKDLEALRKASVVTIKRRQVFPAIKIIDKPASNLHFRCHPDPELPTGGADPLQMKVCSPIRD